MQISKSTLLSLSFGMMLAAGCTKSSSDTTPPEPAVTTPPPSDPAPAEMPEATPTDAAAPDAAKPEEPPAAPALTDAEIAAISKAANDGEIEHAKLAKTKAKDKKVKDFAAMMTKDHTDANKRQAALAKKAAIEPKESDLSKRLVEDAKTKGEALKNVAKGAEFDRAYIDGQVEAHTMVLDTLDKQMIPAAQNPELKAELEKVRGAVEMHLNQAKEIQAGLAKPAA